MSIKKDKDINTNDKDAKSMEINSKLLAAQQAIKQINSEHGEGSVMFLKDNNPNKVIDCVSTGSLALNYALGMGGIPRGRVTEIYGNEGSGKTTIALHVIANSQKTGGICAFIDAEHALDVNYAQKIGIDLSNLIISQPNSGEEAIEIVERLVKSHAIDVVVIDSVAALVPKAELEGSMEDVVMGGQARLMSKALRKVVPSISKSETACIFINQIRSKIGVMFGSPETTSGGNALKFYASVRIEVKKRSLIKKGEQIVGQDTELKVTKNKFFPPFQKATFELIYGEGINNIGELIDLCVLKNILQKSGTWFSYGEQKLGQGKEIASKNIKADINLYNELMNKLNLI